MKQTKSPTLYPNPCSKAYWRDAALELKDTRMLVFAALMIALRVALKSLGIPIAADLRINVAFFINALGAMVFGPVVAVLAAAVFAAVVSAAIVAAVIIALAEDDNDIDVVQTEVRGKRLDGIRALDMDARAAGVGDPADADDGGLLNIGINAPVVDMVVGAGDGHGGPRRHFHAGMIGLRVRAERVRVGHGEGRIVVVVAQDGQKQVRAHARHVAGGRRGRAERKQRQRECQQEDGNHECLLAMSCFFHVDYIRLSH